MLRFSQKRKTDRKQRLALFLCGLAACCLCSLLTAGSLGTTAPPVLASGALIVTYIIISRAWMITRETRVPVLVYHSVTAKPQWLPSPSLAIHPRTFERQMKHLKKSGFRTADFEDLHTHITGKRCLTRKSIGLTFDDGYLDNWTIAYPILKKHNLTGTIFVSTDFISEADAPRKTAENAREYDSVQCEGYLNWAELAELEASGVLDVQSHTQTHTWLFTSGAIEDFYHPGDRRHWLVWNQEPWNKPAWRGGISSQDELKMLGRPVYAYVRAHLAIPAYIPDQALSDGLNAHALANGGREFFKNPNWRKLLAEKAEEIAPPPGRMETEKETERRLEGELHGAKKIIEANLAKEVKFLCWPGDKTTPELGELARKAGFLADTGLEGYNRHGENSFSVARLYIPRCRHNNQSEWINLAVFAVAVRLYMGNYYYYIPFLILNGIIRILNRAAGQEQ